MGKSPVRGSPQSGLLELGNENKENLGVNSPQKQSPLKNSPDNLTNKRKREAGVETLPSRSQKRSKKQSPLSPCSKFIASLPDRRTADEALYARGNKIFEAFMESLRNSGPFYVPHYSLPRNPLIDEFIPWFPSIPSISETPSKRRRIEKDKELSLAESCSNEDGLTPSLDEGNRELSLTVSSSDEERVASSLERTDEMDERALDDSQDEIIRETDEEAFNARQKAWIVPETTEEEEIISETDEEEFNARQKAWIVPETEEEEIISETDEEEFNARQKTWIVSETDEDEFDRIEDSSEESVFPSVAPRSLVPLVFVPGRGEKHIPLRVLDERAALQEDPIEDSSEESDSPSVAPRSLVPLVFVLGPVEKHIPLRVLDERAALQEDPIEDSSEESDSPSIAPRSLVPLVFVPGFLDKINDLENLISDFNDSDKENKSENERTLPNDSSDSGKKIQAERNTALPTESNDSSKKIKTARKTAEKEEWRNFSFFKQGNDIIQKTDTTTAQGNILSTYTKMNWYTK